MILLKIKIKFVILTKYVDDIKMEKTLEELMILFLLKMKFKIKDLEMTEFPSTFVLKFTKWNAASIKLLEDFVFKFVLF